MYLNGNCCSSIDKYTVKSTVAQMCYDYLNEAILLSVTGSENSSDPVFICYEILEVLANKETIGFLINVDDTTAAYDILSSIFFLC